LKLPIQFPNQLPDYPITRLPNPHPRPLGDVGRAGKLELVFERRSGRTVLAHQYAEAPLRVGAAQADEGAASLILVCSGPGIFAGDTLQQSVHVKSGACVVLTSQSALQVHPSSDSAPARITHHYRVDADAELHCQWDPVIPFADARLEQRFEIDVEEGGRLYWSDALMSGRASRGEAWRFVSLAHELHVRIGSALVYLERYGIFPADRGVQRRWMADGDHYFANAVVHHPAVDTDRVEALHRLLGGRAAVRTGVDVVAGSVLVARVTSASGAVFADARRELRRFAVTSLFERPGLADRK
jgi:urease accessory protein UreH